MITKSLHVVPVHRATTQSHFSIPFGKSVDLHGGEEAWSEPLPRKGLIDRHGKRRYTKRGTYANAMDNVVTNSRSLIVLAFIVST